MIARLTIVTSSNPQRLTKEYSLTNGTLSKNGGGSLIEGQAEIREIVGLDDFKTVLESLRQNQALVYGVPPANSVGIVSRDEWIRQGSPSDPVPRSSEIFRWPEGAGVMMFDYDPPSGSEALSRDELVSLFREVVPALRDIKMLWWPSASSYIVNTETNEEVRGLNGQRLYILVKEASDIPRAGKALTEMLWAAGHGHFDVSISGRLLDRTTFDGSIWQTNRLDFAAGAACILPLKQARGAPEIIDGKKEMVDSRTAFPEPSPEQIAKARALRSKKRKKMMPEAQVIRAHWIEERVELIAGATASDEEKQIARETAQRAVEHGSLSGDFILYVVEKGETVDVRVMDVLAEPDRFDGLLTLDPLEPDYDGGRHVGKLYLVGSRPRLFSFAHGGCTYRLQGQVTHIKLVKGRTHEVVLTTLESLRAVSDVFDFGGALVTVENGRVYAFDEAGLTHFLGGEVQYWEWKSNQGGSYRALCDPPARVTKPVLALGDRRNLKPLKAVVTGPTLRPDGSVMDQQGYDPATGLLFETGALTFPVPDSPSDTQVADALDNLLIPFRDFPLVCPLDWGVLLAALLTAATRPALPTSPAFGFDAPSQASGKTLLASCVATLATGLAPTVWPHTSGRDDEESRKRLFVALRNGDRALVWDNVTGVFDSAAMAAALTSESMTDRVLGKSESCSIPNRAIFLLTGNNLTLSGDLARRVLKCRIDTKSERPFARQFELDPQSYVRAHRQEMLASALTIVRGYLSIGGQRAEGRMASFELWDDYVRQSVVWVGHQVRPGEFDDPMNVVVAAQSSDPEQEAFGEFLKVWHEIFGSNWKTANDVFKEAFNDYGGEQTTNLREALNELKAGSGKLNSKGVGRLLSYRRDRVVFGRRLEARDDRSAGSKLWRVVEHSDA